MFLRNDHGVEQAGGANARSFGRALVIRRATLGDRFRERFPDFDPVPDLGSRIGSGEWFRGVATCAGLCALAVLLAPGFERPIYANVPAALTGTDADIARAQAIAPMAAGSATGTKLGATSLVANLTDTPERPILQSTVTLGRGGGPEGARTDRPRDAMRWRECGDLWRGGRRSCQRAAGIPRAARGTPACCGVCLKCGNRRSRRSSGTQRSGTVHM